MAKYILGIDEGTTGARAFVIDDQCEVLGLASAELTQHYPRPGWIEHDPIEILNVQLEVIRAALRQAKLQPSDLTAVALTNQRETGIVWEKDTGRPIYNAVVWASRQTVDVVEQWVEKGHGDMIEQRTGLIPDAYYTASKIRFILDAVPGAQERAERGELLAGTVDTWLIWNLTGRRSFVTEFSNASRTMMFNLETREWDDDLLAAYNIPKRMLAEIVPVGRDRRRHRADLRRGHPDRVEPRRPAGRAVRAGGVRARPVEDDLRHGGRAQHQLR